MTESEIITGHFSVETTHTDDQPTTESRNNEDASSSRGFDFYFSIVVIIVGIIGLAANGLILYALVAAKEYKKHVLIFNQNVLDLFSSLWLIVTYAVKLSVSGFVGYWMCLFILTDNVLWWGIIGSKINLMSITIERYLKVIRPTWSKELLRNRVVYPAAGFAWIGAIVYNMFGTLLTINTADGACFLLQNVAYGIWHFASFSAVPLAIFAFCYWRILLVVRRQARVMAGHVAPRSTVAPSQADQIETNVIKAMVYATVFFVLTNFPLDFYFLLTNFISFADFYAYYLTTILTFICISTNPFIYATKYDPVKSTLLAMIPCKNRGPTSDQPLAMVAGPSGGITNMFRTRETKASSQL